jgi:membrane associated rhomboid family serine protease
MNIWAILLGFIIGFFPLLLVLRFFKGKFLFVANPYIKGALFGFLLWIVINVFIYFEVRYNVFGLIGTEEGFDTIVMFTASLQGFITAGLAAAFMSVRMWKKKAPKS